MGMSSQGGGATLVPCHPLPPGPLGLHTLRASLKCVTIHAGLMHLQERHRVPIHHPGSLLPAPRPERSPGHGEPGAVWYRAHHRKPSLFLLCCIVHALQHNVFQAGVLHGIGETLGGQQQTWASGSADAGPQAGSVTRNPSIPGMPIANPVFIAIKAAVTPSTHTCRPMDEGFRSLPGWPPRPAKPAYQTSCCPHSADPRRLITSADGTQACWLPRYGINSRILTICQSLARSAGTP